MSYPMLQLPTPDGTYYIVANYINDVFILGKKTCVNSLDSGAVMLSAPLDQVLAQVRQAGITLIEVQDRSYGPRFVVPRYITRVLADRKGFAILDLVGSNESIVTKTPAETIVQQLAALS
jgi:hypothetical protein